MKFTLNSQCSLRPRFINSCSSNACVLAGVQLGGVRNEQRVVVGHSEPGLALEVYRLSVVQPYDLQLKRVIGVGVTAEGG